MAYKTTHGKYDDKYEDRGTACVQDRMIMREKELVSDLVREHKLNQDNYLVKDGSLEYRPTKEDRADKKDTQCSRTTIIGVLAFLKTLTLRFAWI